MDKMAKITVNGQEVPTDCPKCKTEDSLYGVSHMKWGKINKWQHFYRCESCNYETKVD